MPTTNQPQQQPAQQAAAQNQAQQPQQPQVQNNMVQSVNPLKGVFLPSELNNQNWANVLCAPYVSFMECFDDKKAGAVTWHREIEFVVQKLSEQSNAAKYLRQCFMSNPQSLVDSVKQVALTGLSLDPQLKSAYLVPFKGVITFMASYTGLRDILVRTGLVKDIEAYPVFRGETFRIEYGSCERLYHEPNPWDSNRTFDNMVGCYWRAILPDGTVKFGTMSKDEIIEVKKRSPSGDNGPWKTDPIEMSKKTLVRRAFKSLPHTGLSDNNIRLFNSLMTNDDKFFIDENQQKKASSRSNDAVETSFDEVIATQEAAQ